MSIASGRFERPRFERACAELMQALANFIGAVSAELSRIESTVPPHSHPPRPAQVEPVGPVVTDRSAGTVLDAVPGGDCLDVSSLTSPAEPEAPPASFREERRTYQSPERLQRRWTAERLAVLQQTYTAGVPLDEILNRLNALPATDPVAKNQIGPMANNHGWKRPEPTPSEPAVPALPSWSPERIDRARQLYESGSPLTEIMSAANALPGPDITLASLASVAATRGWKRGSPPACGAGNGSPVVVTAAHIIQWAGERGIVVGRGPLPMDAINAKRTHLGMAPFAMTSQRRAAR